MGFVGGACFMNIDLLYSGMERLPGMGEEIYAKGFDMQFGGGLAATMINLGRLGIPSKVLSFMGKDSFSEFARRSLEDYGVNAVNLYEGDGMPLTVSATMICKEDRSFASYRDDVEITPEMLEQVYEGLTGADVIGMHVGFLEVYKRLKNEKTIQIFDTGWEDDLSIEKYREYLEAADYYVPNQKEALKITGTNTVEEAAEKLSEFFSDVIIKLDKDGCLLKNSNGTTIIPPMQGVVAVDSTGAGDAFLSGFMYGLYHHYPIEDCIRFGNVTGGTCVQGIGCLTKYVNEEELLRLAETLR